MQDGSIRPPRIAVAASLIAIGLAAVLTAFVASLPHDLGPSQPLERALALGCLFGAVGAIGLVGSLQRRPALVAAAGFLYVGLSILSVATIGFAVVGLVLMVLATRVRASGTGPGRRWDGVVSDGVVGMAVVVLVAGACLALLGTTEHRCWQAFGSASNPVYGIVPCSAAPTSIGGPGGPFAAGEDGGALTRQGEAIEAVALAGALALTLMTARRRSV